jgi:hypothetical protein
MPGAIALVPAYMSAWVGAAIGIPDSARWMSWCISAADW